ncbi:reverse transcriptase domain-containing protein [Tanacetum coccineum]
MPKYAKFLKGLLTNKARLEEACTITMNERCSTVLLYKLPSKEKDPVSFTIPCDIGQLYINNALADLGASISLMPYTKYEKLGLGEPKATRMSLELADRVGDDEVIFDVDQSIKKPPAKDDECYRIDDLDDTINAEAQELLANDGSNLFLLKGLEKSIDQSDLESFEQKTTRPDGVKSEHLYLASANEIDEKRPELKSLPNHLEYAYLQGDKSFPIIISSKLSKKEKRRLNPKVQDVVKNEIVKLLDFGLIYPILDSSRLQDGECASIIKNLMIQLERIISLFPLGFFQIPIAPEDQEKTTFTYPYWTFAYKRMSFGLCNALATFQRCVTAIFHDMVKDFMEVFMDDLSVFGNSFDCCLANLDRMFARCEETNLVLNWEKCHFMVKERIVLGHKISGAGIEVDRAKIDVIAKLSYPTKVKGVRNFLGHARFYRRFIKDFSMISKPMTKLLMKDAKFDFYDDCKKAFNILKERLTTTPIIISPDWNVPFELMCDASDFAVRVVLVVFSFDKFRLYLVLSKTVVYIDHSALKYLFSKQDAKLRLIRWALLLQGLTSRLRIKKGAENLVVDHLSRLENPDLGTFTKDEIADEFPNEHIMILKAELNDDEPWLCPDNVMRQCIAGSEILEILAHCHSRPTEGHHSASITRRKVYESGFFWPSIFKDAKDYVMRCDACQRLGNISSRTVDYVSKWVEAQARPTNDARIVIKFLRKLFERFRVPKALIVIMEYLVKISKKARILELKQRNMKIIVLTSNTSYPSRKIRHICACTSPKTIKDQGSIRRIQRRPLRRIEFILVYVLLYATYHSTGSSDTDQIASLVGPVGGPWDQRVRSQLISKDLVSGLLVYESPLSSLRKKYRLSLKNDMPPRDK